MKYLIPLFFLLFALGVQAKDATSTLGATYDNYRFEADFGFAYLLQAEVIDPSKACEGCELIGGYRHNMRLDSVIVDYGEKKRIYGQPKPEEKRFKTEKFYLNDPRASSHFNIIVPDKLKLSVTQISLDTGEAKEKLPERVAKGAYVNHSFSYGTYTFNIETSAIQTNCNEPQIDGEFEEHFSVDYEFYLSKFGVSRTEIGCPELEKPIERLLSSKPRTFSTHWGINILLEPNMKLKIAK